MEKIYMDDYNENQDVPKKKKIVDFSVILSFVVALFAVVSLVAVGFSSMSYAVSNNPIFSGDSFTFYFGQTGEYNISIWGYAADTGGEGFYVPVYLANSPDITAANAYHLFCIEHNVEAVNNSTYNKDSTPFNNDIGLIYIFNKSRLYGGSGILVNDVSSLKDRYTEVYGTQVAIWLYMYEKYFLADPTNNSKYSLADYTPGGKSADENYNFIKNAKYLEVRGYGIGEGFDDTFLVSNMYSKIRTIVDDAKKETPVVSSFKVVGGDQFAKDETNTFFQTSELSVASNNIDSYKVTISGVNGAKVIDKDHNEKYEFGASDKFYITVPIDKVPEGSSVTINVKVDATAKDVVDGSYFVSGGLQKVALITGNQVAVSDNKNIDIARTPDTAMNKTQTIYFIGLVVLLCGVGIIYANAKKDEAES